MTMPRQEYLETTLARLEERIISIDGKVDGLARRLDTQNGRIGKLETRAHDTDVCVGKLATELRIKAGIWGAIGAAIPSALAAIIWLLKN